MTSNKDFARKLEQLSRERMQELFIVIKKNEGFWQPWRIKWMNGLFATNLVINDVCKEVINDPTRR
jgi:hypothetical protein